MGCRRDLRWRAPRGGRHATNRRKDPSDGHRRAGERRHLPLLAAIARSLRDRVLLPVRRALPGDLLHARIRGGRGHERPVRSPCRECGCGRVRRGPPRIAARPPPLAVRRREAAGARAPVARLACAGARDHGRGRGGRAADVDHQVGACRVRTRSASGITPVVRGDGRRRLRRAAGVAGLLRLAPVRRRAVLPEDVPLGPRPARQAHRAGRHVPAVPVHREPRLEPRAVPRGAPVRPRAVHQDHDLSGMAARRGPSGPRLRHRHDTRLPGGGRHRGAGAAPGPRPTVRAAGAHRHVGPAARGCTPSTDDSIRPPARRRARPRGAPDDRRTRPRRRRATGRRPAHPGGARVQRGPPIRTHRRAAGRLRALVPGRKARVRRRRQHGRDAGPDPGLHPGPPG